MKVEHHPLPPDFKNLVHDHVQFHSIQIWKNKTTKTKHCKQAGKKSLSRRACQTVLFEISQALIRILSPVMPHQAEDIWQNVLECQKQSQNGTMESILLANWPLFNPRWDNEELEVEFAKILKKAKPENFS